MIHFYKNGWANKSNSTSKITISESNNLHGFIKSSDVNILKTNLLRFKNTKIEDGDIVCFGKDNITRDKLKDLNKRIKFKRVTDETKANTLVIDDVWFEDKLKESQLEEHSFLSHNVNDKLYTNGSSLIEVHNNEIYIGIKKYVSVNNSYYTTLHLNHESCFQILNIWTYNIKNGKKLIIEEQRGVNTVISKLNHIINSVSSTKKIILASSLQHQFNEDNIELNEETYNTLKSMFLSSDTENTSLALEILANAKIPEENRVLVTLLLYNNYYAISPLIKTNNINKFLKLYKYEYKLGREPMSYVMGLLMDKYYSPKFEPFIKSLVVDYINKHLFDNRSSKRKIIAVELS